MLGYEAEKKVEHLLDPIFGGGGGRNMMKS